MVSLSALKDNPSDLLELNFWGGMLPETESLQIKFPKWMKALNPWREGEEGRPFNGKAKQPLPLSGVAAVTTIKFS